MTAVDPDQALPRASRLTCQSCGGYVVVLPGWSIYCSTCKTTTTTTTTVIKELEQEQQTVPIVVNPSLSHPFAWWSEDHILALRPCPVGELPDLLETVAAHIRANTVPKPPPLFQNSTRTEAVDGDIVRDQDGDAWRRDGQLWCMAARHPVHARAYAEVPGPLLLLWDAAAGAQPEVSP